MMSRKRSVFRRSATIVLCVVLAGHLLMIFVASVGGVVFSIVNPPVTSLAIDRTLDGPVPSRPYHYVPLADIRPQVRRMFLMLEDSAFYSHPGIVPEAIVTAYRRNKVYRKPLFGGSTITQQLVRTLFLNTDKSYVRKYIEVVMSVVFDAFVSKDRILELYLNNIEWGRGVYGIGSAARFYFKRDFRALSVEECARLAVIITNPIRYDVWNFGKNPGMSRRYAILTSNFLGHRSDAIRTEPEETPQAADGAHEILTITDE